VAGPEPANNAAAAGVLAPLLGVWVRVLRTPKPLFYGGILVLATLGTYSLTGSLVDLAVPYVVGAIGYLMRVYDFPLVPAVLGLLLGPLAEQQLRRAVVISQGDLSVSVTRPIAAARLTAAAALLLGPVAWRKLAGQRTQPG
jgi:putative tricarboxylic transport membrane protein